MTSMERAPSCFYSELERLDGALEGMPHSEAPEREMLQTLRQITLDQIEQWSNDA